MFRAQFPRRFPKLWRAGLVAVVLLALDLLAPPIQAAIPQLSAKLAELAAAIKKEVGDRPVKVGDIARGVGVDTNTNSGTGIEQDLQAALTAAKVELRANAELTVLGTYAIVSATDTAGGKKQMVRVKLDVQDLNGESLLKPNAQGERTLKEDIDSVVVLGGVAQASAALPPLADDESNAGERSQKLADKFRDPTQVTDKDQPARVRAEAQGKYAIEVLVQSDVKSPAVPRPAIIEMGKAFVALERGELYVVRIHNPTDREVAVSLTIDGLDIFHFSAERKPDGSPQFSRYIIEPRSQVDLSGWFVKLAPPDNYLSFQITDLGGGAISQELKRKPALKARGPVGVIHATFAHTRGRGKGGGNAETGIGPPRSVDQKAVERDFDPPHEFIAVRYRRP